MSISRGYPCLMTKQMTIKKKLASIQRVLHPLVLSELASLPFMPGPWSAVIAYDACVRLCLLALAKQCMEAPMFLKNECALLRNIFRGVHVFFFFLLPVCYHFAISPYISEY
ncbi:uncharacterized protein LOC131318401 isoform X1 [Rhododendron vialii]|uniref:uncharacterized protein LOC131318401 isoform X1 n=1 Tax=Rhododendron vialii TaxID=182163 RepID=UPI002660574A|nr:uncharacterized protein LOC131318401 isoform X1 [Rhododendron vialii]XP_058204104.1 uncharacterized protein LOC131318401 isoform X1 [Rhododendron vialii]